MAGAPTWPIKPPEVYKPFGPDLFGRRLAVLVSQSAGDFSCGCSVLVCDGPFCSWWPFCPLITW